MHNGYPGLQMAITQFVQGLQLSISTMCTMICPQNTKQWLNDVPADKIKLFHTKHILISW